MARPDGTWRELSCSIPLACRLGAARPRHGIVKAQLEIKYHSKDFLDESIELLDFRMQTRVCSSLFLIGRCRQPAVRLNGVMPSRGELAETAEASRENANSHVILLAVGPLKKVSPPGESAPN